LEEHDDKSEFNVIEDTEETTKASNFLIILLHNDPYYNCWIKVSSICQVTKNYTDEGIDNSLNENLI